jgi:Family of unknown function (DUF6660)
MKLMSIILAMFILGITASPCSDNEQGTVDTELAVLDIHQSIPTDIDFCSPLCSCHCCHSHITEGTIQSNIEEDYPSIVDAGFHSPIFDNHYFSIFQPPKV